MGQETVMFLAVFRNGDGVPLGWPAGYTLKPCLVQGDNVQAESLKAGNKCRQREQLALSPELPASPLRNSSCSLSGLVLSATVSSSNWRRESATAAFWMSTFWWAMKLRMKRTSRAMGKARH